MNNFSPPPKSEIIERNGIVNFPPIGSIGKIYIDSSTDPKTLYVWDTGIEDYVQVGSSGGGEWGGITGTLAAQADLQAALDSKVDGTLTESRVPFASDANTLTDSQSAIFNDADKALQIFTTFTQKVLNGNFTGNASNWTLNTGWGYNSNAVYHSSNGTGILTQANLVYRGGLYLVTYTLTNPQTGSFVGTVTPSLGGVSLTQRSAPDTYRQYVFASNNSALSFTPSNTARLGIDSVSVVELSGGSVRTGNLYSNSLIVAKDVSSSSPNDSSHISLRNKGSYSWIDSYFGNSLGPSLGFHSGGSVLYNALGAGYHSFTNNGQTSFTIMQSGAYHPQGFIAGLYGVHAGSTQQPKTTLQASGSFGAKWIYLADSAVLSNNTPMYVISNADEGEQCSGSPSFACASYTTEVNCNARSGHGGCYFDLYAFRVCNGDNSVFNYCEGDNSQPNYCPEQYDESSCNAQSGCYWNYDYGYCEGDNSHANTCSEYTDDSACTGAGCTSNITGNSCPGYANGEDCLTAGCSPEYGVCYGTPVCANIHADCASEPGCSVTHGITVTMTDVDTYGGENFFQTFFIKNIATTYNTTLLPYNPSNTKVAGSSSVTLGPGETGHFSFHYIKFDCGNWNGQETACNDKDGCTYDSCSAYTDEPSCGNAGGVCSWNYEGGVCAGGGNCTGINVILKDWVSYPCAF